MEPARPGTVFAAAMADTLLAGTLGLCVVDARGRVMRREGKLAGWAPEVDADLFAHPVIECLRDRVFALRPASGDMTLPGLGLAGDGVELKVDIRFAWMEQGSWLLVTSTEAAARTALDGVIAQGRRERQILSETLVLRERQLAGQRRLMALFIAHVPAAIAMLDRSLRYVAASRRWRQDFGLGETDVEVGAAIAATLAGVSPAWRDGLEAGLAGKETDCPLDQVAGAHGGLEWVRWRFVPWELPPDFDDAGPESGVLLFCEIITRGVEQARELEQQARRLRGANVDMRNFSLVLSHDLQAPVRQMMKFAGLVESDAAGGPDASSRAFLAELQAAGARMQGMIGGLSRYLRVAARQPARGRVELADCLAAALANLRGELDASQGRVEASGLPTVLGDRELLTLLFQNIVQNAVKYAGALPPRLRIEARREGGRWVIACADNGPGLRPARAAKAFGLFQRLDERAEIPGAGVGLAICRWIADVHEGTIALESAPGAGLSVTFDLPAFDAAGAAPAAREIS